MNILLIDCDLGPLPDHNVKHVHLPLGGLVSIFKFLGQDENGEPVFYPDLIVQREQLGARIFLLDLEKINCLKIFWAIDSHLNLHWQTYYARLFDVLLTPHTSLFKKDHTYPLLPPLYNFSVPGHDRKLLPNAFNARPLLNTWHDIIAYLKNVPSMRCSISIARQNFYPTKLLPKNSTSGSWKELRVAVAF